MTDTIKDIIGKRVDVLDKGWIELVDLMPHPEAEVSGDLAIVNAARVSFLGESKGEEQDKKLLFYLLRNYHTSPFEMVEFKFRVRAPLVTWWQWVRHRTWNFNAQCLDGDTEIIFNRPEAVHIGQHKVGSKIKLADLYQGWQNPQKQERLKKMYLRTVNEDTMLLDSAHIGDIVHAGVKDGFKIIMENGKEIICSADHRFLFEDGWQTLKEATGLELVDDRAAYQPELPRLYMNGIPVAPEYSGVKLEDISMTPHLVDIQKIEYVGQREMYDIVVDGDYPNFVANWFVVHNSGRYTPFEENDFYVPDVWRRQSKDNKQASEGQVTDADNQELTDDLIKHYEEGFRLYEKALKTGVSREMARLFLPGFSVYYTWVTKIDAHNLMHFLRLRMASDAQHEIRVFADAIYEHFFKPALPWTAEAFEEYRMNLD